MKGGGKTTLGGSCLPCRTVIWQRNNLLFYSSTDIISLFVIAASSNLVNIRQSEQSEQYLQRLACVSV